MERALFRGIAACLFCLGVPSFAQAQASPPAQGNGVTGVDWLTWGYDQQRTGWNRAETTLGRNNVARLKLLWSAQLPTAPRPTALTTLTSPIVVKGVSAASGVLDIVYVVGIDDTVYALDAASGHIVWQRHFQNPNTPLRQASVNCANAEQATPVADKVRGVLYATTGDGLLRGLDLASGSEVIAATPMVAPFSRNWSLNIVDNVVYTAASRGCGGSPAEPIEAGVVSAIDVSDPMHPWPSRFYTSRGRPAGPWGAGGPVLGPQGLYVATADGANNPGGSVDGNALLAVRPHAWGMSDSFVPSNWKYLNTKDLDLGSGGPVVFDLNGKTLVAEGAKEAVVYLLDAGNLGGPDHSNALYVSPRLGNDEQTYSSRGIWGGMATYRTASGDQFLYVPMWGPPAKDGPKYPISHGDAPDGSIMAFKLGQTGNAVTMTPAWISCNISPPAPPVVANGVVYALQAAESTIQHPNNPQGHGAPINGKPAPGQEELGAYRTTPVSVMTLFALDAQTGAQLWSSKRVMEGQTTHFAEPVVAAGKLFVVDHNAHVWAFGL